MDIINRRMDRLQVPHEGTEPVIEALLAELDARADPACPLTWLVTARLAELTLLGAGHCADNGAFRAAGDLLFTPRRVLIHRKGDAAHIVKPRHARVSDVLGLAQASPRERCRQLVYETITRVAQGPLFTELADRLRCSRAVPPDYIDRLTARAARVAGTIGALAACDRDAEPPVLPVAASRATRDFVAAHQCRFQGAVFRRLGEEVRRRHRDPRYRSPFLL